MKVVSIPAMQPNADGTPLNPFSQDAFNMGARMGTNVYVMMGNQDTEACKYLIIVDAVTGERLLITFDGAELAPATPASQPASA